MAGKDVVVKKSVAEQAPTTAPMVPESANEQAESTSPATEYQNRLERHYRAVARYAKIELAIYRIKRLMIFGVIGYVVFDPTTTFLLMPLFVALVPLVIVQVWAIRGWRRTGKRIEFYQRALARVEDRWLDDGDDGSSYADESHPYSSDLDIFGHGSLYQLMCTARTRTGCGTLADWLQAPADAATIIARQQAVIELRGRLDLREDWAVLDADASRVDLQPFEHEPPAVLQHRTAKALAVTLGVVLALCLLGTFANPLRWWPILSGVLIVEIAISFALRDKLRAIGRSMRNMGLGVGAFGQFAALVRQQRFEAAAVDQTARRVTADRSLAQRAMARVCRLAPQEPFFLWLWLQVWPNLEQHHSDLRQQAAQAFRALGEFEALSALASYAFEHPGDPFPEIAEDGPHIEAIGLGHPLIPQADCVRNDIQFDGSRQLILVSGSNMSGKSTLLRSLGTNVALALAGAPVRAQKMSLTPVSIGTAMRFRDSVHDGTSYFFAVVRRLKQITDLLDEPRPLLFLIDEMLQGTNSHDRRVGAEAIVQMLIDGGAVGLITTHDLTLTEISDALGSSAANMHFEDQVSDGKMTFDYKIKPGVVQKSNALELMRIAGLKV